MSISQRSSLVTLQPEASLTPELRNGLRGRLLMFYETVNDYSAFCSPSRQNQCWAHVVAWILERLHEGQSKKLRIVEIGAGRSGFGAYLSERGVRHQVEWVCQDVTKANADWLNQEADQVCIGDVSSMNGLNVDLVFSTYVFEHVIDPSAHLTSLRRFLISGDGGSLMLFSPRYDIPGYLCPATRHLRWSLRARLGVLAMLHRIRTYVTGVPAFLIQTDLAAFHMPFFTDADAVHWVSRYDLNAWARQHGATLRSLQMKAAHSWSRDAVIKRHATLAAQLEWSSGD
jgi:hypothetical protein